VISLASKAVILARGLGRRMRTIAANVELTAEQAQAANSGIKALVPLIDGKTMLELIGDNVTAAGFSKV